ncbi:hypothetical protein [Coleofasciculus chthonoplastes]|uniref:hypothetical protein n=1 Tax=Coleofasciculus chthonoplastes TaxID=64178 RepID=UPI0032F9DAB3
MLSDIDGTLAVKPAPTAPLPNVPWQRLCFLSFSRHQWDVVSGAIASGLNIEYR